jgi:hypothetical protein
MAEYLSDRKRKLNVGIESYTNNDLVLYVIGNTNITGVVTSQGGFVGNLTGISSSAYKLENSRTFEITGDIVAPPVSFNGTSNVSFASSIQPNTVGLGTHTYGNYVKDITGTIGEIEVTNGTGEGSSAIIGLPNDVFITNELNVSGNVHIDSNLDVTGNITIGGTTAFINVDEIRVRDKEIVLGISTNSQDQIISTDLTANGGGLAIASTEGNPLVVLQHPGIATLPATFKKILWIKANTLGAGTTDAWIYNYAVGIGSTQVPNNVYLAVGGIHLTDNKITAKSGEFNYLKVGILTSDNIYSGIASFTNLNVSGVSTLGQVLVTQNGIVTSSNPGVTTVVYYGDGSNLFGVNAFSVIDQSLISTPVYPTFANNAGVTSVGIASTQVAYIPSSGNFGIGTTAPTSKLHVVGNALFTGIVTALRFVGEVNANNISGIVSYSANSGIASNLKDGQTGSVPYQSNVDSTSMLNPGIPGHVFITGGANVPPYWGPVSAASGAFGGITVQEDGVTVGTANSITTINFTEGLTIIATAGANGIATVSSIPLYYVERSGISTSVIGGIGSITSLIVTGISTFTNGPVLIGTGTSTGTSGQRLQVSGKSYFSDNIGIAITNPTSKLHVVGDGLFTGIVTAQRFVGEVLYASSAGVATSVIGGIGSITSLAVSGITTTGQLHVGTGGTIITTTTGGFVGVNTTNPLQQFQINSVGSNVVVIDNTGELGIGTTNPQVKLDVIGNARFTGIVTAQRFVGEFDVTNLVGTVSYAHTAGVSTNVIGGIGSITALTVSGITTTERLYVGTGGTVITTTSGGFIGVNTTIPIQPFQINPSGNNVVVIDNIGELGIGTTNPQVKLDVIGNARFTGIVTASNIFVSGLSTVGNFSMTPIGTGSTVGGIGVTYYGDGSRLTGIAGGVSISTNTTNQNQLIPYSLGTGTTTGFGVTTGGLVFNPSTTRLGIGTTTPASNLHIIGNVLVTGVTTSTDFNSSSDETLKTNIRRINNPVKKVMGLNGVQFDWIATQKASAGLIAQDVQKILPELTSGDPLSLNYNGIIGLLVEVVKQQQLEIEKIQQQLNKLS